MSRWLDASRARGTRDNWERTDNSAPSSTGARVRSVESLLTAVRTPENGTRKAAPQRQRSPTSTTARCKSASALLPVFPATCAVCGRADWRVSLSDLDGRTYHVGCAPKREAKR